MLDDAAQAAPGQTRRQVRECAASFRAENGVSFPASEAGQARGRGH
jgi:hypothetical protein